LCRPLIAAAVLLFLSFTAAFYFVRVNASGNGFHYYGHIPPGSSPELIVVGFNDDTSVELYDITDPSNPELLNSTTLNKGRAAVIYVYKAHYKPRYFKVVSNKRIGVLLTEITVGSTLYPAITGGFAGKEFVLMSRMPKYGKYTAVYAYEDAKATLYDEKGNKIMEIEIPQGKGVNLDLVPKKPYRLVSTGRLLIISMAEDCITYLVDEQGRLKGKHFGGGGFSPPMGGNEIGVVVIPYEAGEVKIYDNNGKLLASHVFEEAEAELMVPWVVKLGGKPKEFKVVSTGMISVLAGNMDSSGSFGDDAASIVIPADEKVGLYMPSYAYAAIIASESTTIAVGGELRELDEDEHLLIVVDPSILDYLNATESSSDIVVLPVGTNATAVRATRPVTVQVNYLGGWDNWCTYILAVEDAELSLSPPKPGGEIKEVRIVRGGGGIPFEAVIGGVAGAAVVAVVLILRKRKT